MAKRTREIIEILNEMYGTEKRGYLVYTNAWELLVATIMAAQCTDARVNVVTKTLFPKYPTIKDYAEADLKELEEDIRSTGFYHNKAKNIIAAARMVLEEYGGEVPSSLEELVKIPGVGRKTANVIRGNIFDEPSVVVDTHVKRISKRLGMTKETDPTKVEFDLMRRLPKEHWILWNLQIITFGREICKAQRPLCGSCPLISYCCEKDKDTNRVKE
ncbi:MAG: endonuclease III [Lachnospiraceae bacterium]|nr:endonuclease III [Candidatus Equihabitans merdae]